MKRVLALTGLAVAAIYPATNLRAAEPKIAQGQRLYGAAPTQTNTLVRSPAVR
jgi:hypothetical protein